MRESNSSRSFNYIGIFLFLIIVVFSIRQTGFNPAVFLDAGNLKAIGRFTGGLWPPETSPAFLVSIGQMLLQTVAIALLGSLVAVMLAFPLSLAATRTRGEEYSRSSQGSWVWIARWSGYYLTRALFNLLRGIPELVWALIFIVAVGLGPFPGVLALAAHSTGVLGKLYAEIFEAVDQRLVEPVRSTGAGELNQMFFVRLPVSLSVFLSYTLFRLECNLRAATILGFVGAGGIGTQLVISMKLFNYGEVATLVIVILLMVTLIDLVGQFIRQRILDGSNPACRAIPSGKDKDYPTEVIQ